MLDDGGRVLGMLEHWEVKGGLTPEEFDFYSSTLVLLSYVA